MMRLLNLVLFITMLYFPAHKSGAQELETASDLPLEISAEKTLEWDRAAQIFTALGNAIARQGETQVKADQLKAAYTETNGNNIDIRQVEALGNVILSARQSKAYGDRAVYDLKDQYAILTGQNLYMEATNQKITAQERFEYWVTDGKINAIGDPVITQITEDGKTNTLKADIFTASLKENAQGKTVFHTLEAKGNVIITTPDETLTGRYGIYNAETNTAEVRGSVRITRGPNVLEGEKAQVDLNTSISRLIGSGSPQGRVRGVFYPDQN